jgi:hypothetical protein
MTAQVPLLIPFWSLSGPSAPSILELTIIVSLPSASTYSSLLELAQVHKKYLGTCLVSLSSHLARPLYCCLFRMSPVCVFEYHSYHSVYPRSGLAGILITRYILVSYR